ncbi:MFS transporter [Marinithermus hydrothermalis]|uniref:Major facilitator superfamily MFS_1 n=1 Tax=Marinithermus hydrothermalis (strain DSM 14884 / JCM 11576 / T1) TaxID=869210 RepID=F2NQV5_MARHT|nr:MFS transporter [Marinithermus hydrothermalis]AEB12319.1 major facilitator superfamily MFS_1 [Marinithermus hydrothermalis DSM 14884]
MLALELLRDPLYRRYWISLFISQLGTWMQAATQAWLVLVLTGSAERLGLVVALQFAPSLFFSLLAGVVADRTPKRRLLLLTQTSLMLLALGMSLLIFAGAVQYWHVLIFAALYGTANVFDLPTRQAFTVELAGRARYPGAISLNSFGFNLSRLVGPAVAGLVIARYGMGWTFLLNALSFIPLILVLRGLSVGNAAGERRGNPIAQALEGLRYVWATPLVRTVVLLMLWVGIFGINFQTLIPAYARLELGLEAGGYGFLLSALGLGALGGALWQAWASSVRPARLLLGAGLLGGVHLLLLARLPAWGVAIVLIAAGFAMVTTLISANTTVQTIVPDRLRGRVMSIYSLVLLGTGPLGAYLTGLLFEALGGRMAAGVLGACTLAGWVFFLRRPWPRRLDAARPEAV